MTKENRAGFPIGEYRHLTKCRFCLEETLEPFIDFGYVPLAGGFLAKGSTEEEFRNEKRYPLQICLCTTCGLVHGNNAIPGDVLYKDYFYFSSAIKTLATHFENYAKELAGNFADPARALAVELGCNDGVLLKPLRAQGFKTVGVDPATNVVQPLIEQGYDIFNDFFGEACAREILAKHGKADLFLTSNSFAHIDDMHDVLRGIKLLLKSDGQLAFENHYLPTLIREMHYDMMYHEHMSYYSLYSITHFLAQYDMEVFDVIHIPIHGGSVRYCAQHKGNGKRPISANVARIREDEAAFGVGSLATFLNFGRKVEKSRDDLLALLGDLKKANKTIMGYGASGRATQLSAFCGIGKQFLDAVIDDAPQKQGAFTPGNHLPIVDSSILSTPRRPDYALLFAWAFRDEITKRNRPYLEQGGQFIVPLPELDVVGK